MFSHGVIGALLFAVAGRMIYRRTHTRDLDDLSLMQLNRALPFAALDNGDYLALDLQADRPDPPVVYLNHDDESAVIAGTFVSFLRAWERLCYLGPEHWLLLAFSVPGGQIDAESERAARLRQLLAT